MQVPSTFSGKIEGLLPMNDSEKKQNPQAQVWAVLDRDDTAIPAELCKIALSGTWMNLKNNL